MSENENQNNGTNSAENGKKKVKAKKVTAPKPEKAKKAEKAAKPKKSDKKTVAKPKKKISKFRYLSGLLMTKMAKGGAAELRHNADEVNKLNVFPVPDGDTGDNMRMTSRAESRLLKILILTISER